VVCKLPDIPIYVGLESVKFRKVDFLMHSFDMASKRCPVLHVLFAVHMASHYRRCLSCTQPDFSHHPHRSSTRHHYPHSYSSSAGA
jgi:hypothetical protein